MIDKTALKIAAKINLTLDVKGTDNRGYHVLDTIMASVGIYDTLEISASDSVFVEMLGRINDETNAAYKTLAAAMKLSGIPGAEIRIKKGIPFSAGMGGSSADISGVLLGLERVYGLKRSESEKIAASLGSDAVFMLNGGLARCKGYGNEVSALNYMPLAVVVVKPFGGANTGAVFKKFDLSPVETDFSERFISRFDIRNKAQACCIGNALTSAAADVNPNIPKALLDVKRLTDFAAMTGSGSAVYGLFDSVKAARVAAEKLSAKYPFAEAAELLKAGADFIE